MSAVPGFEHTTPHDYLKGSNILMFLLGTYYVWYCPVHLATRISSSLPDTNWYVSKESWRMNKNIVLSHWCLSVPFGREKKKHTHTKCGCNKKDAMGDKQENRHRLSDKLCVFCLHHLFVLGLVSGRRPDAETTSSSSVAVSVCTFTSQSVVFCFVQQDRTAFLNTCLLVLL